MHFYIINFLRIPTISCLNWWRNKYYFSFLLFFSDDLRLWMLLSKPLDYFLYFFKAKQIKIMFLSGYSFFLLEILKEKVSKMFQYLLIPFILIHDISFNIHFFVLKFLIKFFNSVLLFLPIFQILLNDVIFILHRFCK